MNLEGFGYRPRRFRRIVMLSISLVYFFVSATIQRLLGSRRLQAPVVLTYHAIHADETKLFERQMNDLRRRAEVVFPDTPAAPPNAVVITFDDALQSVLERALPILRSRGMPSTIFVPTGYLGAEPGWIDPRRNPQRVTGRVASVLELKDLDPALVRLGSHTVTHPRLAALDAKTLRAELRDSKAALEGIAGRGVRLLSLPYGSWSPAVIDAAGAEGYDCVFANVPVARNDSPGTKFIGRIDVSPRDWPWEFRLKIRGAYEWMSMAVPAKRELRRMFRSVQEA